MEITLGSLFDGIGGFPLAALRNGIKTLWASEIEPFCIKVTKIRFPDMKHCGDITKINGAELEPVDIITGGSPCQDLSVAGKRAGLAGERSGLFMEMVRVVREMREHEKAYRRTNELIRPRFMVWENVPGAFSSNKGEDFRAVLEETARIADETAVIPRPPKGKWNTAGCIMGNSWSIAWRVLDAQYWGVPQRRRRIFLVADFGGQSAPEVLFKREGLSRHLAKGGEARGGTAADVERGTYTAVWDTRGNGDGKTSSCITGDHQNRITDYTVVAVHQNADGEVRQNKVAITLNTNSNASGRNAPLIAGTVSSKWAKGTGGPAGDECYNLVIDETAHPLSAQPQMRHRLDMDNVVMTDVAGLDCRNGRENGDLCGTLQAKPNGGFSYNCIHPVRQGYSVRRLTPLECERLQDYPDGWTNIPGASDSARYKALGNSIAVCCAEYVLEGIKEIFEGGQNI